MKDHKRVLVFARHPSGGIRTYFRYVYGDPVMKDIQLAFITPSSEQLDEVLDGLSNIKHVARAEDSAASLLKCLLKTLMVRKFDLVHSHGFTAGMLASLPAFLLRIPHVVTTHDVFLEGQFSGPKGKLKRWLIGRVLRLARVINPVGSDAKVNFLETYPCFGRSGKVRAIRNGINPDLFAGNEARSLREESGISSGAILVGFFGRFMAQKGFGTLVTAVEQWNSQPDRRPLHVACFGWGGFIREEQQELVKKGIEKHFHFFPATNDMGPALRGVDAVVMPSRWEACPLLPMEAMVAGVPVIASDCIGLKEVTRDTPALTFDTLSVDSLLKSLSFFEKNELDCKKDAIEFRAKAAKDFDSSLTSHELRDLYQSL